MAETYTYCFLRKDLPSVVRAIQLAHATQEIGKLTPGTPVSNLVLFEVANQEELVRVGGWLHDVGIKFHNFYEPDIHPNGEFTAIACEPLQGEKRLAFQGFKLFRWEDSPILEGFPIPPSEYSYAANVQAEAVS